MGRSEGKLKPEGNSGSEQSLNDTCGQTMISQHWRVTERVGLRTIHIWLNLLIKCKSFKICPWAASADLQQFNDKNNNKAWKRGNQIVGDFPSCHFSDTDITFNYLLAIAAAKTNSSVTRRRGPGRHRASRLVVMGPSSCSGPENSGSPRPSTTTPLQGDKAYALTIWTIGQGAINWSFGVLWQDSELPQYNIQIKTISLGVKLELWTSHLVPLLSLTYEFIEGETKMRTTFKKNKCQKSEIFFSEKKNDNQIQLKLSIFMSMTC